MKSQNEFKIIALDSIVQLILQMLLLVITSRYVGPAEYGVYSIAYLIINVIKNFGISGISINVLRRKSVNSLNALVNVVSILSIVMTSLLFISSEYISVTLNSTSSRLPIILLSSSIIFVSLGGVIESYLIKVSRVKEYLISNIITVLINISSFFIYLKYSELSGEYWLTFSLLTSVILRFFLLIFYVRYDLKVFNPIFNITLSDLKIEFKNLYSISAISIINNFALNVDNYVISKYLGATSLGLYNRAFQIGNYTSAIYTKIISKLGVKKYSECNRSDELEMNFNRILCYTGIFSVVVSLTISMNSELIVNVFFGDKWSELAVPMSVLSYSLIFRFLYKSIDTYILSLKMERVALFLQLALLFNMTFFTLYFVDGGLISVCYSIVISSSIQFLLSITWMLYAGRIRLKYIIGNLVIFSIIFILYKIIYVVLSSYISVINAVISGPISFLIICWLVYVVYNKKNKKIIL
ncbi:oligosaccharide flippase family protein [Photobacterium leiognathi]|uniref:oligosaccharide flippase family protein n=1 Tax=Photobacterium leiognathi TaxID=553611 RepID=UPI000D16684C|nr:oligosaccharide flippase family protein [Photobacterium leiognathi]PSW57456.1 hypothetical protein C0W50_07705 [Photobacterium leiognathi subsp. mandapamensis]